MSVVLQAGHYSIVGQIISPPYQQANGCRSKLEGVEAN